LTGPSEKQSQGRNLNLSAGEKVNTNKKGRRKTREETTDERTSRRRAIATVGIYNWMTPFRRGNPGQTGGNKKTT